jgi:hypothetical protein
MSNGPAGAKKVGDRITVVWSHVFRSSGVNLL